MDDSGNANWGCSTAVGGQFSKSVSHGGWFHNTGANNLQLPALETDVPLPAQTIMVAETQYPASSKMSDVNLWNDSFLSWGPIVQVSPGVYNHNSSNGNCTTGGGNVRLGANHFGGQNLLYADYHVKWQLFGATRASDWTLQDD